MARLKLTQKAAPLVADVLWRPLDYSLGIVARDSVPLNQFAELQGNGSTVYTPDRRLSPVVLCPVLSVSDPDGVQTSADGLSVTWSVEYSDGSSLTVSDTGRTDDDFVLEKRGSGSSAVLTGSLIVRRNCARDSGFTVRCHAEFRDVRRGSTLSADAEAVLYTKSSSGPVYGLQAVTPRVGHYNPFGSAGPQVVFEARAKRGVADISDDVRFFWEVRTSSGTWVAADGDASCAAPVAAYVSGQGTRVLTMDMEYAYSLNVRCRMGTLPGATSPDVPAVAEWVCGWRLPRMRFEVYSPHGSTVRPGEGAHAFGLLAHAGNRLLTASEVRDRLRLTWYSVANTSTGVRTVLGSGSGMWAGAPSLMPSGGRTSLVGAEVELLGARCLLTYGGRLVCSGGVALTGRE